MPVGNKKTKAKTAGASAVAPRVLITAGPTHEPIDGVRYIANRSSGRMGLALAEAAVSRGWPTTLLLGPTHLNPPNHSGLTTIRFQTTADLEALLNCLWPDNDVLLMAAAVADYRPVPQPLNDKLKRQASALTMELEPTPDLVGSLAAKSTVKQTLIGFALEPADRLMASAQSKLKSKGLHAIVANPLETMDSTDVTATVFLRDGTTSSPASKLAKAAFGEWLLDQLTPLIRERMVAKSR